MSEPRSSDLTPRREGESPAEYEARVERAGHVIRTEFDGGEMVWRRWGSAPRAPLVLFHGGFGSWRHWIVNLRALSEVHTLYVADLPGLGDSDVLPGEYAPERIAAALGAGVRQILPDDEPLHLCGFSFGGIMGSHVARLLGDRVRSFTAVAPGGTGQRFSALPTLRGLDSGMSQSQIAEVHRANLASLMIHDPGRVDDLAVHVQLETVRRARARSGKIPRTDTFARALSGVTAEFNAIWGEEDVLSRTMLEARRELLQRLQPGSGFHVIPDAGHWVMYEQPDAFDHTLLRFLDRFRD